MRAWAKQLGITLVPTPTYASWLNRIECHFGAMLGAVFAGSDYRSHDEIQAVTAAWLRRATPRLDATVKPASGNGMPAGPVVTLHAAAPRPERLLPTMAACPFPSTLERTWNDALKLTVADAGPT